ncbi:MAG: hypothetical protein JST54_08620 [Deltaproteobacteria bacterium]|nr:hypothetical protein [Deltaproteobacteria bacterium]
MRPRARELAAVALLAALAHAPVLTAGFTWLDHGDLEDGAAIAPPGRWLSLFTHGFARTGFYRPFTALTLSLDAATHLGPAIFHLTNLLWHALVAMLLVLVGVELGLARRAALLAGALFAVHPVTSIVVGAISYRAEALVTVALLLAILAQRRGWTMVAFASVLVAGLSKETGLALAPLVLMCTTKLPLRPRVALAGLAGFAVALGLRLAYAPAWRTPAAPLTFAEHVGTRAGAFVRSALALVAPVDGSICDDTLIRGLDLSALCGFALAILVAVLALRRRGPWLLFAVSLIPALDLVPAPRFWSPHYFYLPLAFLALGLANAVGELRRLALVAAPVLALLVIASWQQARRYRDDRALFEAELEQRPSCREGWLYVGDVRRMGGDLEGAALAYQRAVAPHPGVLAYVDLAASWQNLGVAQLQRGEPGDAEAAFRTALTLADARAKRELTHDLAAARFAEGHADEAAQLLESETARPDASPASIVLRAKALESLGRTAESAALLARLPAR